MKRMNQTNKSKAIITDNYTVKKEKIMGITVWMYIPKEEKEKEMKETNLEHYKAELKEIFNKHYEKPKEIIKGIKGYIGETITYDFQSCTDAILNWMAQPYKKPILDNVEREYLSAVIKPFRKKVRYICKKGCGSNEYIDIGIQEDCSIPFPDFKVGSMYKGMEFGKDYTLKELGL